MFSVILYAAAAVLTAASFRADRAKTRPALKKAWRSFENILPSLSAILLLSGLILAFLDEDTISALIGAESGFCGIAAAAVVGSAALIPGFVAFPLAASLLRAGAGYAQLAALISALMMVGVATFPLEAEYFGRRAAAKRNLFSFAAAVAAALLLGRLME